MKYILIGVLFLVSQFFLEGCAHKKIAEPMTRRQLQNKRVALAEIRGATESKSHVEVAIINEIIDQGRFEIIDRSTVQDGLVTYPTESDWQRLGKKINADYILSVRIAEFKVTERQGLDSVVEEDSVLEEESGEHKPLKSSRYVKVKSYDGSVKLDAIFFDIAENAIIYEGTGAAKELRNSRDGAIPGKMELLEKLSAKAIRDFFEKMP